MGRMDRAASRNLARELTTAERVCLRGPRRFGDMFNKSAGAKRLLVRGLIDRPVDIRSAAPLTTRGQYVLEAIHELEAMAEIEAIHAEASDDT